MPRRYHRTCSANSSPRYPDFRDLIARRDDTCHNCTRKTRAGDRIWYARGIVYCVDCFETWTAEVRAEDELCRGGYC